MTLVIAGLSHHTAPIEVRERVAIGAADYAARVEQLCALPGVREAVIVGTCNRLELICWGGDLIGAELLAWIHRVNALSPNALDQHFYVHQGEAAVRHLIKVAGGLDSLVIGEPQILGQMKEAWLGAKSAGTVHSILDRLFQHTFSSAKRIRSRSEIGEHPVSVAYTTAVLARQIFEDLSRQTIVLVGAGDMIALCAQHLGRDHSADGGHANLIIANRNQKRAIDLARRLEVAGISATVVPLRDLGSVLPQADILITSTASKKPIISQRQIKSALKQRKHRPMFIVDIAVPRDIEAEVARLEDVYLYTIDDLQQVVDENLSQRSKAAQAALPAVEEDARAFMRWLNGTRAARTLENIRSSTASHGGELKLKALRQLKAGQDPESVLNQLVHTLTNRILHGPSTRLRQAAESGDYRLLGAAERIFRNHPATDEERLEDEKFQGKEE